MYSKSEISIGLLEAVVFYRVKCALIYNIAALVVGVIIGVTGAVVLIVFSVGIAIKCYILKRKARKL